MSTTGKHFGPVGRRKLFSLWPREREKTPIAEIIEKLEECKEDLKDEEIRLVFFFDN